VLFSFAAIFSLLAATEIVLEVTNCPGNNKEIKKNNAENATILISKNLKCFM
jgi:hypothetical protein